MSATNKAETQMPPLVVLAIILAGFLAGFLTGLSAESYQTRRWLLDNNLAKYDSRTGELIITLPGAKNDGQPLRTHGPL
jgi:ABC-type multidrug transport system permease subunit